MEASVVSRWERVSKYHNRRVNNDLLTPPRRSHYLSTPSAPIQAQSELSAKAIQLQLVPVAVIQLMERQRQVEVSISEIVENSQQSLNNLR